MRSSLPLAFGLLTLVGCAANSCSAYEDVPPNAIAMMLTPSGYDGKVYPPGQVDVGTKDSQTGQANKLVLIQRSSVSVEESFLSDSKGEDHRCLLGIGAQPMSLDVRLILALPDYETPQGKKDLARLFVLGNPKPIQGRDRALLLDAKSVYNEQATLQVRGRIRQICAQYENFAAVYKAFAEVGPDSLSAKIEQAVAQSLVDNQVPLRVMNAVVSNMKPDQSVIDAIASQQAAVERTKAIQVMTDFLNDDPTGMRRFVYRFQVIQEIISKAGEKGHDTIFMTDTATPPAVLPLSR